MQESVATAQIKELPTDVAASRANATGNIPAAIVHATPEEATIRRLCTL